MRRIGEHVLIFSRRRPEFRHQPFRREPEKPCEIDWILRLAAQIHNAWKAVECRASARTTVFHTRPMIQSAKSSHHACFGQRQFVMWPADGYMAGPVTIDFCREARADSVFGEREIRRCLELAASDAKRRTASRIFRCFPE